MVLSQRARVLITVKASPEPSEKYGDTVCVAGVRLDQDKRSWIRLYPVPMRWMTTVQQFHKYEILNVDLIPAESDKRPESFRIDIDSVERDSEVVKSTAARGAILEPLVGPSMCDLRAGVVADSNAASLGLVRAQSVKRVIVENGKLWTAKQQAKIDRALQRDTLFGGVVPPELKPPRFVAKYKWECQTSGCPGHEQTILDWELTALQLKLKNDSDEVARQKISTKFETEMCGPSRRPYFFVGNMADPTKRRSFSVLGVYSPPAASSYSSTLDLGI